MVAPSHSRTLKRSPGLLLFGILLLVWMKWRRRADERSRAWDDAYAPDWQDEPPPTPHIPVGLGVD